MLHRDFGHRLARFALVGGIVGASLLTAGCASDSWDATLESTVNPIDTHVHRRLRDAYLTGDADKVLAFYDLGAAGEDNPIAVRRRALLARFQRIDRAIVSLRPPARFDEPEAGYASVAVRTFLYGQTADGPLMVVEDADMVVRHADPAQPMIVEEAIVHTREVQRPPGQRFTDVAAEAGLTMVAASVGVELRSVVIPDRAYWYGATTGDYDSDGDDDLYLVNGVGDRLYRNDGAGNFEDVTAAAGLEGTTSIGQSAQFGDFDNDGHPDLLVVNLLEPNQLFHNQGDGTFLDVTTTAGFPASRYNTSSALFDYDRDGDLDIFIVGGGDFVHNVPQPIYDALNGTPNVLLRNDGGLRFTDVSAQSGVNSSGWGLGVSTCDYDDDGDTDFYVSNDFGMNNLYRNNGDGTFTDVAEAAGVTNRGPGMGCTWGDYDGDGHVDLFVSNMFSNSEWMLHHSEYPLPAPAIVTLLFRSQVIQVLNEMTRGSTLFRNRGDGTFEDVSETFDVRDAPQWAWGCSFFDMDNDGDEEIYVANGMITGEVKDDL